MQSPQSLSRTRILMIGIGLVGLLTALACESPVVAQSLESRGDAISVVVDKAPDCRTLKSIVESVTRGCKTNDEKAIALYNFLRLANYTLNYPS